MHLTLTTVAAERGADDRRFEAAAGAWRDVGLTHDGIAFGVASIGMPLAAHRAVLTRFARRYGRAAARHAEPAIRKCRGDKRALQRRAQQQCAIGVGAVGDTRRARCHARAVAPAAAARRAARFARRFRRAAARRPLRRRLWRNESRRRRRFRPLLQTKILFVIVITGMLLSHAKK
jgi:hypothetical protein